MQLENYRIIFITAGLIGMLLFTVPTLDLVIKSPQGEQFSELYILGPNHMLEDIPFNIQAGVTYTVYLGVGNQMKTYEYYTCVVKLRNEIEPLPNQTLGTPSPINPLYEYKAFTKNGESWEAPLTFQVNDVSFYDNESQLSSIKINGLDFTVNKQAEWNPEKTGYYYSLLIELWLYNTSTGFTEFHNRSVYFYLNMTQPA